MNPLLLILLVIGASAFMSASAFKEAVSFRITKIKPDYIKSLSTGLNTIFINANFDLINPTDFFVSIDSINMEYIYKGYKIADFGISKPFEIKSKSIINLSLPVEVHMKSINANAKSLIDNIFTTGVTLDITGVIRTNYGNIHYADKTLVEV